MAIKNIHFRCPYCGCKQLKITGEYTFKLGFILPELIYDEYLMGSLINPNIHDRHLLRVKGATIRCRECWWVVVEQDNDAEDGYYEMIQQLKSWLEKHSMVCEVKEDHDGETT